VSHNEAAQYRLAVLDDSKQRYLYGNHLGVGRISTPVTLCAAGTLPTTHSATGMTPRLPSAGGHTSHTPGVYPPLPPPLDPQIKRIVTMVEPTPERAAAGPKPPPSMIVISARRLPPVCRPTPRLPSAGGHYSRTPGVLHTTTVTDTLPRPNNWTARHCIAQTDSNATLCQYATLSQ
jgi:hypothetical protein